MSTPHVILIAAGSTIIGIATVLLLIKPRISYLRRRLFTDPTTGLLNYEGFLNYLKRYQKKESFVLFLLDLDDFRRFNRQSYDTGDVVLKLFATRLSKKMNGIAICARYRLGDEFLLVAHEKDTEKVSSLLANLNTEVSYKDDPVHFSSGIAAIECNDASCFNAIRTAHDILMSKKI